jgi:hypothetical protein
MVVGTLSQHFAHCKAANTRISGRIFLQYFGESKRDYSSILTHSWSPRPRRNEFSAKRKITFKIPQQLDRAPSLGKLIHEHFSRNKSLDAIATAEDVLAKFSLKLEDKLSFGIYICFLGCAVRHHRRDEADRIISIIMKHYDIDAKRFLIILKVHTRYKDAEGILRIFHKCRNEKIDIPIIHERILSVWASIGNPTQTLNLFTSMAKNGSISESNLLGNIISSLIEHDEKVDMAYDLISKNDSTKAKIDFVCSWLRLYCRLGRNADGVINAVLQLLEIEPSAKLESIWLVILDYAGHIKNHDIQSKIKDRIEGLDLEKMPKIQAACISFLIRCGKVSEIRSRIDSFFRSTTKEKVGHSCYSRIISAALAIGELNLAFETYDALLKAGLFPTPHIIHRFLVYYLQKKEPEKGLKLYERFISDGGYPNGRVFEVLLELSAGNDEFVKFYWKTLLDAEKDSKSSLCLYSNSEPLTSLRFTPPNIPEDWSRIWWLVIERSGKIY